MSSIEILRGYSASGKSTYARESGKFIVSRDLIRQQFGANGKTVFGQETEAKVSKVQEAQVRSAVAMGLDVVIDDTNLVLKFARRWADLAVELGVDWSVRDFQPSVLTAQAWNDRRSQHDHVPYTVVESQAKRFPYSQWQEVVPSPAKEKVVFTPYVPDTTKPYAVGFDLDGTLAHMGSRSPYDESRYHEDTVDKNLQQLNMILAAAGATIIIFSGRSEDHREVVETWLDRHGVVWDLLVMRKTGDLRRDDIVKSELFDEFIAPNYNFLYHFDDRNRVVQGLRSKGITVYQVCDGDY